MPVTVAREGEEDVLAHELDLALRARVALGVADRQRHDPLADQRRGHAGLQRRHVVCKQPGVARRRLVAPAVLDRGGLQHRVERLARGVEGQAFEACGEMGLGLG